MPYLRHSIGKNILFSTIITPLRGFFKRSLTYFLCFLVNFLINLQNKAPHHQQIIPTLYHIITPCFCFSFQLQEIPACAGMTIRGRNYDIIKLQPSTLSNVLSKHAQPQFPHFSWDCHIRQLAVSQ